MERGQGGRGDRDRGVTGERCPILHRPPSQGDISPPSGVLAPEDQGPNPPSSSLGAAGLGFSGCPQWLLWQGWGRLIPILSFVPGK